MKVQILCSKFVLSTVLDITKFHNISKSVLKKKNLNLTLWHAHM